MSDVFVLNLLTEALKFCTRIGFFQSKEAALVWCKQCDCGCCISFCVSLYICIISLSIYIMTVVFPKHIFLPEQFRHIIVIVNQSLTSEQKMNWRHFVGVFFLVLVLNIGLFIHLSIQQQVFIMCRSNKNIKKLTKKLSSRQSGQIKTRLVILERER